MPLLITAPEGAELVSFLHVVPRNASDESADVSMLLILGDEVF